MIAAIFPGQGSQKPGMGSELFDDPRAQIVLSEIKTATGVDLRRLCTESDEDTLRQTQNAQMALYGCGVLAHSCMPGVWQPSAFAGHSIGEYSALAASGAVSVADGARLVARRGELMAQSGKERPGTMAAVLGLERPVLEEICAGVQAGVVVVANDNCPGQLVISGDVEAVKAAGETAAAAGARRVMPLNVSGAFHSPLMEESAKQMRKALDSVSFGKGTAPVYSNVTAAPVEDPSQWPALLEAQLCSPVRWTESVRGMLDSGIRSFVEFGAGEVLCGLVRRIDKEASTQAAYDRSTLSAAQESLAAAPS